MAAAAAGPTQSFPTDASRRGVVIRLAVLALIMTFRCPSLAGQQQCGSRQQQAEAQQQIDRSKIILPGGDQVGEKRSIRRMLPQADEAEGDKAER